MRFFLNPKSILFDNIIDKSYNNQLNIISDIDNFLIDINKQKYTISQKIINYINDTKIPNKLIKQKITLLTIMDFFQKKFVLKKFYIDTSQFKGINIDILPSKIIFVVSKINNLPHLLGVSAQRDKDGIVLSKIRPRKFLDGVLYQWILIDSHINYNIDFEKLEVFPWISQTLSNPTYILTKEAINIDNTKFMADLIFIKAIWDSDKYSFHIVGLKSENGSGNFAFVSQFAITKKRYYRIKLMFDFSKSIYSFYNTKQKPR